MINKCFSRIQKKIEFSEYKASRADTRDEDLNWLYKRSFYQQKSSYLLKITVKNVKMRKMFIKKTIKTIKNQFFKIFFLIREKIFMFELLVTESRESVIKNLNKMKYTAKIW
jgi:hypothetical protein